ncbi:MAG TPA: AAA family ATPase, partial [Caulobacteraceae bacterium]
MAELQVWLTTLGLERYASVFEAAEVDFLALPHLTEDDFREIGIPLGPRRLILAALAGTADRPGALPASPVTPERFDPVTAPERRQITVMFVDLVGSTRMSVEIDPEVLAELLTSYKDLVARAIAAAGGRVAKYLGDGVLAYFGWPQAREDAAETSIRCGFQVVDLVRGLREPDGKPLQCRIGIATGLVVVGGEAGEGPAREDNIAGEALNLAARLQALASPGAMVISDATHRQVGQLFECEALGEHALSGFSDPVRAWRPLRQALHSSRFRAARSVRTSFVGREHELSLLADRWRTAAEGTGRAVLILGEAGMGKSRLAEALQDRILGQPHGFVTWQCSPYHQTRALYPIVEYLTLAAAIADTDPPATRLEKLARLLGASRTPLDDALPIFAQVLAIPPDGGYAPPDLAPAALRSATIAALSDWVRRIAALEPLLLLLEDAHWIDATTLELVTRVVGGSADVPMLTVLTARPEFVSPWNGRPDVSIIGLDRLNNRDCEVLIREIASVAAPQGAMVKEILSRSDGNPLFVEELSAGVFEAHANTHQAVPDSLQSSLMARLDQLGGAKHTAQLCSVLGRRFALPLLAQVSNLTSEQLDGDLSLLVAHDVIRSIGGQGEPRYEFKHALVRDAAYESLLLSERRRLHQACGRELATSFPEAARTEPELLAQHFRLAGLPLDAATYAEQAGDRAATANAMVEAASSYEDALRQAELLPQAPERDRRILALLLKLGPALVVIKGIQNPELRVIYRRAEALSRAVGDVDALFKSVWGLWFNTNVAGELDDAAAFAQELVVISGQSDDEDHKLEALHCRWSSGLFAGDCVATRQDSERGIELYDSERHHRLGLIFGGHDPGVCAFGARAIALAYSGDIDGGLASLSEAIALAETLGHPHSLGHAMVQGLTMTNIVPAHLLSGYAERLLELGRKFNAPPQEATAAYHL